MARFFKHRHRHGKPKPHFGLAEKDGQPKIPELPKNPPPAAYEANVFGKLDVRLQHAIADAGYAIPTPIQEKAIPPLLEGRDLIGCAQTGTGKTAAFMLPILDRLVKVRKPRHIGHPRALVLSPTRELAVQTAENVRRYNSDTVLLADLPSCVNLDAASAVHIPLLVSNFGGRIPKALLQIRIRSEGEGQYR